jgi:hypothetical protein
MQTALRAASLVRCRAVARMTLDGVQTALAVAMVSVEAL